MIRSATIPGIVVFLFWIACIASAQTVRPRPVGQQGVPAARPGQQAVAVNDQAGGALAPEWIPLEPAYQQRLDQILRYWEHSTSEIQRYRCRFKRWEYEPTLKTYSEGVIKYAAPDKGLFKVESLQHRRPPQEPGGEPQWVPQEEGFLEHWVCDGQSIFQFDYQQKRLVQHPLPPEAHGQRITEGPLPFLFGAKAEEIKQRFWIRPIFPANAEKEHWLEAIPKTQQDAADFRKLKIVIDHADFLPKGMQLFHRNNAQTTFVFENRENNWNVVAQQLNLFHREFFEPRTPNGWRKVVEPLQAAAVAAPRQVERRPLTIEPR